MKKSDKPYQLDERLVEFTLLVIEVVEKIPYSKAGNHLAGQLVRSGTSPALHYGEVQSAESRKDFIHKVQVILKELRETHICLKIIKRKPLLRAAVLEEAFRESAELIAIFIASIKTARQELKNAA